MLTAKKFSYIVLFLLIQIFYFSQVNAADYPNTSLAVIDINKILNESKVAISANEQIEEITNAIQEEITKDENFLLEEQKKLIEAQSIMAPEAFEEKRIEHEKNVQDFQIKSQETLIKIENIIANVRAEILDELRPILESVSEEKGITVILEKGIVILNAENLDITKQVLKKLDKQFPKIKVEFEE